MAEDNDRLIEELSLIRNALTLLCYYTATDNNRNISLTEVKELVQCI